MKCPKCGGELRVVEVLTDEHNDTHRTKRCLSCGKRVFSVEVAIAETRQVRDTWLKLRRAKAQRLTMAKMKKEK